MKTLREIQDEVVDVEYPNYTYKTMLSDLEDGYIGLHTVIEILDKCFIEVQKQQQHLINKRVEEDWLSGDFDTQSIINDKNIIQ